MATTKNMKIKYQGWHDVTLTDNLLTGDIFKETKMNKTINSQDIVNAFAAECAEAYIAQFCGDRSKRVMNNPVVYYNATTGKFGWCSSLTPLSDDERLAETIEEGIYGDVPSDWSDTYALAVAIAEMTDHNDLLTKCYRPRTDGDL